MTLTVRLNPYLDAGETKFRDTIYVSKVDLSTPDDLSYPTKLSAGDDATQPGLVNLAVITSDDPGELQRCVGGAFILTYPNLKFFPISKPVPSEDSSSLYVWFIARRKSGAGGGLTTTAAVKLVITISTDDAPVDGSTPSAVGVAGTAP